MPGPMALGRRTFLGFMASTFGGGSFIAGTRKVGAIPDNAETSPRVEFPPNQRVPTVEEILASQPRIRGKDPPYKAEIEFGRFVMGKSPSRVTPFEVARFFEQLRLGQLNSELGPDAHVYGEEWPIRANPVIVSFFDATTLRTPSGDQTPWCAAFVNWCIQRALENTIAPNSSLGTGSAASASFREWGTLTTSPREGDLAVFQHRRERNKGHVGFFVSSSRGGIYVLGGNQMPFRARAPGGTYELRNTGEINTKFLPMSGRDLELLTFRTHSSLHL